MGSGSGGDNTAFFCILFFSSRPYTKAMPLSLARLTTLTRHLLAARPSTARSAPPRHFNPARAMASSDAQGLDKATPDTKWKEILSPEEVRIKRMECLDVGVTGSRRMSGERVCVVEIRRANKKKTQRPADVAQPPNLAHHTHSSPSTSPLSPVLHPPPKGHRTRGLRRAGLVLPAGRHVCVCGMWQPTLLSIRQV